MELKFNPGEGVAHLSLADKGLSIMACRSRTSAETEQIRKREEALSATENTRQLDELLRLSKGVTRAPADNFWELKINIATFMSLVWVLFVSECDYYKGLHNVYAMLELKEVMAQKSSFAPDIVTESHGRFLMMGARITTMSKPPYTSRDQRKQRFHNCT